MRISDWSSDVCSSDLLHRPRAAALADRESALQESPCRLWLPHNAQPHKGARRDRPNTGSSRPGQRVDATGEGRRLLKMEGRRRPGMEAGCPLHRLQIREENLGFDLGGNGKDTLLNPIP